MHKITLAQPKENYCVYLEYDDGATFLIDGFFLRRVSIYSAVCSLSSMARVAAVSSYLSDSTK